MSMYVSLVILLITVGIISYNPAHGDASEQGISKEIITDTTISLKIRQVCCKDGECSTVAEGETCNGTFQILLQNINIGGSRARFMAGLEKGEREILITKVDKDGNPDTNETKNLRLLRSIESMFATQFGPTTLLFKPNGSTPSIETKQPQEIQENKEVLVDPETFNYAASTGEEDESRKLSVNETEQPQKIKGNTEKQINPVPQNPNPTNPDGTVNPAVTVNPLSKLRVVPKETSAEETDEPQMIYVKKEKALFQPSYENIVTYKTTGGHLPVRYYLPTYVYSKHHDEVNPIGFSKTEIEKIRLEVLYKANYYRSLYGMKKLYPDDNMNYFAQDWVNQLAEKSNHLWTNSTLVRSTPEVLDFDYYGENLFTSLPIKHVGEAAVDICYYEVGSLGPNDQDYDYVMFKNDKIQRLTQLLWKITKQIGVGAAKSKDGKYYVVMTFNPRGNAPSFMKENLPIFRQPQIDEAKEKLDRINVNSDILLDRLEKGSRVRSLPGWQTMLYKKDLKHNPRHDRKIEIVN